MCAAAKLEDGEAVIGEYRAQADGSEPPLGSGDIGCRKPDMAHRDRRPLIDSLGHGNPFRLSATSPFVAPAKAGVQSNGTFVALDARFRGHDEAGGKS
jgi:hypothetical protein